MTIFFGFLGVSRGAGTHTQTMARKVDLGPVGETVRRNLLSFRGRRGLTLSEVSARLSELGHPMSVSTLSGVENGGRRVDVDDLIHLCLALDISPAAMLMPHATDAEEDVSSAFPHPAGAWWAWLTAARPLDAVVVNETPADAWEVEGWRREQVPEFGWKR
jgi:transcriptional regulator with XRE-family HTH domain